MNRELILVKVNALNDTLGKKDTTMAQVKPHPSPGSVHAYGELTRMEMIFSVDNLSFSWDGKKPVFTGISFTLHPGEIFCILGPNGTGKSTLLRCLMNLLDITSGAVRMNGEDIREIDRRSLAEKIAYVPQGYEIAFPYTVLEYVLMGRAPYISPFSHPSDADLRIAMDAIAAAGVRHLIDKPINQVSGGEHQMITIARALAQQPDILLLDEPTSHLDFGNQMQVMELVEQLSKQGISIIMTSHFPDHAFITSHQVAILRNGTFARVGPAEEVITGESLKETYQTDIRVEYVRKAGRKVCIPVKDIPDRFCPTVSPDLFEPAGYPVARCVQDVYW